MAKTNKQSKIRRWVLHNIENYPRDIASRAEKKYGVSRSYVNNILRQLVGEDQLHAEGATRSRVYSLVPRLSTWVLPLDSSIHEDRAWRELVEPALERVGVRAKGRLHYGFTEMFNNALEHSEGTEVTVSTHLTPVVAAISVWDDGIGIFHKIKRDLNLDDEEHAVLELSKGKLTTDPERHTGEGIFFTSRAVDRFNIDSGGLAFVHESKLGDWLMETTPQVAGTRVGLSIDPDARKPLRDVFDQFTTGEDYAFDVTHVPVALARVGHENLVSRSQAKRLLARVPAFKRVILDFDGVDEVGQAFADEVFRVFANDHPEIDLLAVRTSPAVERMIRRARSVEDSRGARRFS